MLNFSLEASFDARQVEKALKRAEIKALSRAAALIRREAMQSIRTSRRPSMPGQPPHTRKGRLRRSILYAMLEENGSPAAVIGPAFNLVNLAGKAHEFGGHFRGDDYPARPYMRPALSLIANRLPDFFANTVRNS